MGKYFSLLIGVVLLLSCANRQPGKAMAFLMLNF